jgi:hypothetical protein
MVVRAVGLRHCRWWERHVGGGEQGGLLGGDAGGVLDSSGGAGEGDLVDPAELAGEVAPGVPGAAFGHPNQ